MDDPGDIGPWPDEMDLTFEDDDSELLALLWTRNRWGLVAPGIPHELIGAGLAGRTSPGATADEWSAAWDRGVALLGEFDDVAGDIRFDRLVGRLPEEGASWHELHPAEFDETSGYHEWRESLEDLGFDVVYELVAEFIAAWRRGLEKIVVLPLAAPYVAKVDDARVMLSRATLDDRDALVRLLRSWPGV